MKKLIKKDCEKICVEYGLGEFKSCKYILDGHANYTFSFKTGEGEYIVQIIGEKFNKDKKEEMEMQFKVLSYLNKKKFPYEIPLPLKSKGGFFMNLGGKKLWAYKKVLGNTKGIYTANELRDLAKVTAIYHEHIKNFKVKGKFWMAHDFLEKRFKKMVKVKAKNKEDKLMLENIEFFRKLLEGLKRVDYGKKGLMTHADLSGDNVIFRNGKIKGMIDFNNLEYLPKVNDIAVTIYEILNKKGILDKKKIDIYLREYRKWSSLSKKEEELIVPFVLRYYCFVFEWQYNGMHKERHLRYKGMKWSSESVKVLVKSSMFMV
jgi:Ser/Thr protein kinase RdoA (MazF antagonist)